MDLHALRTTLGTRLARQGVTPQVGQRLMRHADYRTTLKHYTVLGLVDTAQAINALPPIGNADASEAEQATGTAGHDPQQIPQQSGHDSVRNRASQCDEPVSATRSTTNPETPATTPPSDSLRRSATACHGAGDESRTRDIQLGKLTLYH